MGGISVELLKHRDIIIKKYPSAYEKIYQRIKTSFKNEQLPERLFANMAQMMTCAYVLQCESKVILCEHTNEEDILNEFVVHGIECIKRQYSIQADTSVLNEFFSVLQVLFDQYQIHEGIHFRFEETYVFFRFPSIYPIFKQKYFAIYHRESPDRDNIFQEIVKMEHPREFKEIVKQIRFKIENELLTENKTTPVTNSLSITYKVICEKFGLDLKNRHNKNIVYG